MNNSQIRMGARALGFCIAASISALVVRGEDPPAADTTSDAPKPVMMEPFVINEMPPLSFGFSVRIVVIGGSTKASMITVDAVKSDSQARHKGMVPMTQILSIDGRPTQDFEASFDGNSDLAKILVGRKSGDKATFTILAPGSSTPRTITLVCKPAFGFQFGSGDLW